MFIRVTGPGAFAGLLTMSLCSVGMVSKMYIEAIEAVSYTHLSMSSVSRKIVWQELHSSCFV